MPLPTPNDGESQTDFMHRCMGSDTIQNDFDSQDQRVAVCMRQWRDHQRSAPDEGGEERGFTVAPALELREEGIRPRLFGYAVVFNSPSRGLPWTEIVRPGAFRAALASGEDIVALFNHDPNQILARRSARTLDLAEDERGLKFEIQPVDTQAGADVLKNVRAGNITGMSFTFQARKQRWDFTTEPNMRELLEVGLMDVSPVTFPAYPKTEVAVRSRDQARQAWEAQQIRFQVIDADRARRLRLAEAGR